jgi:hypothetical protein
MKILFTVCYFMKLTFAVSAQDKNLHGKVVDSATQVPLHGITIVLSPSIHTAISDEAGRFLFRNLKPTTGTLLISGVGYRQRSCSLADFKNGQTIILSEQQTQLSDVVITADNRNPNKAISELDIKLRGVSNSQEVLRMVPGLFIGQHQGGGKAEQIFLRGFDNDHGTDINMSVDEMPINMVSHAHAQGYADSHFIIPETIESTVYQKGMYNAKKGDLTVTGFVNFNTANAISSDVVKAEAGQFHTYRVLGMFNLLSKKAKSNDQSWYAASEYRYSDSYFTNPQHFNRFNFFTKYHGRLNGNNWLSISASSLYSTWKASGQIPESAVLNRTVGFYGAIDPNEGGVTSRTNLNAQLLTTFSNNDFIKNQLYYSRYKFDLNSNFTFYLEDPENGDEIRQREARNLYGYNGSYSHEGIIGNTKVNTEAGLNLRLDATKGRELAHTVNNFTVIQPFKSGDITELVPVPISMKLSVSIQNSA